MTSLFIKLIICPLIVMASDFIFRDVYFPFFFQSLLVGLILAVLAHIMELLILGKGTFWISNVLDFVAALAIVYYSQFFLEGVVITPGGAFLTAVLLFISEYIQHLYLIKNGKVEKSG